MAETRGPLRLQEYEIQQILSNIAALPLLLQHDIRDITIPINPLFFNKARYGWVHTAEVDIMKITAEQLYALPFNRARLEDLKQSGVVVSMESSGNIGLEDKYILHLIFDSEEYTIGRELDPLLGMTGSLGVLFTQFAERIARDHHHQQHIIANLLQARQQLLDLIASRQYIVDLKMGVQSGPGGVGVIGAGTQWEFFQKALPSDDNLVQLSLGVS